MPIRPTSLSQSISSFTGAYSDWSGHIRYQWEKEWLKISIKLNEEPSILGPYSFLDLTLQQENTRVFDILWIWHTLVFDTRACETHIWKYYENGRFSNANLIMGSLSYLITLKFAYVQLFSILKPRIRHTTNYSSSYQ